MKRSILLTLFSLVFTQGFSQTQRNISLYLQGQYTQTIYDDTRGNNPWAVGLGAQCFFNNKAKLKPTIELTGDLYLSDDDVYRLNPDGSAKTDVRGMVNLFAGVSYSFNKIVYLSFVAGPSFVSQKTLIGIKPSFGFYFSKNQKLTGKISYINVFNRGDFSKKDFGSISLSLGIKLF